MNTINQDKLADVVRIFNNDTDPKATDDLIEIEICGDWNGGEERQAWIDRASPQEIADWLARLYNDDPQWDHR